MAYLRLTPPQTPGDHLCIFANYDMAKLCRIVVLEDNGFLSLSFSGRCSRAERHQSYYLHAFCLRRQTLVPAANVPGCDGGWRAPETETLNFAQLPAGNFGIRSKNGVTHDGFTLIRFGLPQTLLTVWYCLPSGSFFIYIQFNMPVINHTIFKTLFHVWKKVSEADQENFSFTSGIHYWNFTF